VFQKIPGGIAQSLSKGEAGSIGQEGEIRRGGTEGGRKAVWEENILPNVSGLSLARPKAVRGKVCGQIGKRERKGGKNARASEDFMRLADPPCFDRTREDQGGEKAGKTKYRGEGTFRKGEKNGSRGSLREKKEGSPI